MQPHPVRTDITIQNDSAAQLPQAGPNSILAGFFLGFELQRPLASALSPALIGSAGSGRAAAAPPGRPALHRRTCRGTARRALLQ